MYSFGVPLRRLSAWADERAGESGQLDLASERVRRLNTRKGLYRRMSWCEKCSVEARRLLNPGASRLVLVAFPRACFDGSLVTFTTARKVPAQTIVPSLPGWSGVKQEIRRSGTSPRADRPTSAILYFRVQGCRHEYPASFMQQTCISCCSCTRTRWSRRVRCVVVTWSPWQLCSHA
jgi:hypothetical protein